MALLLTAMISSCSGNINSNPASDYSENAVALSRSSMQVYMELNDILENKKYQEEFVKILNDLSPDTYIMKSEADYSPELKNLYTVNAFRNLERALMAYNLQLDPNVSTSASNLQQKIFDACQSLDSLNLSDNIKPYSEQLKKNVSSSRFRVEESVFQLTNIYAELWTEESQKWFLMLESYQENIDVGLKKIPVSAFNVEKLKALIDEPYSNGSVLANLYKLKMIKENQTNISELENNIQKISDAFSLLLQVQGELLKKNKNKIKVQELNASLEVLLSN